METQDNDTIVYIPSCDLAKIASVSFAAGDAPSVLNCVRIVYRHNICTAIATNGKILVTGILDISPDIDAFRRGVSIPMDVIKDIRKLCRIDNIDCKRIVPSSATLRMVFNSEGKRIKSVTLFSKNKSKEYAYGTVCDCIDTYPDVYSSINIDNIEDMQCAKGIISRDILNIASHVSCCGVEQYQFYGNTESSIHVLACPHDIVIFAMPMVLGKGTKKQTMTKSDVKLTRYMIDAVKSN